MILFFLYFLDCFTFIKYCYSNSQNTNIKKIFVVRIEFFYLSFDGYI